MSDQQFAILFAVALVASAIMDFAVCKTLGRMRRHIVLLDNNMDMVRQFLDTKGSYLVVPHNGQEFVIAMVKDEDTDEEGEEWKRGKVEDE